MATKRMMTLFLRIVLSPPWPSPRRLWFDDELLINALPDNRTKKDSKQSTGRLLGGAGATPSHHWRAGVKILSRHCCCCTRNRNIAETQQTSKKEESEWDVLQRDLDRGDGSARTPCVAQSRWHGRLCVDDPDIGRHDPVKDVTHSGAIT